MSNRQFGLDPNRVETAMTNHLSHPTNSEHINGATPTPTLAQVGRQDSSEAIDTKPKMSTFKITSVTLHPQKGSSQDGRLSGGEEDGEDDSMVQTDAEESPAPVNNVTDMVKRQDRTDAKGRFKVVKIQKREPYTIGRWRISDFESEPEVTSNKIVTDVSQVKRSDSGNSSRASSTHYVHGVDDPAKNPLASINATSNPPLPSIQQSPLNQTGLPTIVGAEVTGKVGPDAHTNTEHLDVNGVRLNGDSLHAHPGKDPHLIGIQIQPPSQQLHPNIAVRAVAAAGVPEHANTSSNQQHIPAEQSATVQLNTQSVQQAGSVASGGQAVAAAAGHPVGAGSSLESQSSSVDNQHKPTTDEAASGVSMVTKLQSGVAGESQEITAGVEALAANLTELVDPSATAADGEKAEDADATASGVAIDNKIEQAMDLVKSHLMLAVREEVEDLKLQIKQLIERNSQLEQENKLLRSTATQETLAQLSILSRQQNH